MTVWEDVASNRKVKDIRTEKKDGKVIVTARMNLPVGADYDVAYTIDGEGNIKVDADYMPLTDTIPLIPKFGMRLRLPKDMTQIEYLGRGPWENYPDRKRGYYIGHYTMPISEYQHDYIKPQDNGNRCDVHYLILRLDGNKNGKSIRIEATGEPLCVRAWNYGEEDLKSADHPFQLNRGEFVNVNIDSNVHGVGGADTWGKPTLEQYTISGNKPHSYSFMLSAE